MGLYRNGLKKLLVLLDIAAKPPLLSATGLPAMAGCAKRDQVRFCVRLGFVLKLSPRNDVIDGKFAAVLLLRFAATLACVAVASTDLLGKPPPLTAAIRVMGPAIHWTLLAPKPLGRALGRAKSAAPAQPLDRGRGPLKCRAALRARY